MRDFFDHPIRIGDTVAWPCRRGSKLWMNSGSVTDLSATQLSVVKHSTGRSVTIKNATTVISMRGIL